MEQFKNEKDRRKNNGMKDWNKEILTPVEAWRVASNMKSVEQMSNMSFDDWWITVKATVVFIIAFSLADNFVVSIIACIIVPWLLKLLIRFIFTRKKGK